MAVPRIFARIISRIKPKTRELNVPMDKIVVDFMTPKLESWGMDLLVDITKALCYIVTHCERPRI